MTEISRVNIVENIVRRSLIVSCKARRDGAKISDGGCRKGVVVVFISTRLDRVA